MDNKVKIGPIGIGNMGTNHLKDLAKIDNVKLVAVCEQIKNAQMRLASNTM